MANIRTVLTVRYADELPPEEEVKAQEEPVYKKVEKKKGGILSKIGGFFTNLFGYFTGKKAKEKIEEPEEQEAQPQYKPPKIDRKARREALISFASDLVEKHKKLISNDYPPSSQPGEYPARRSGKLYRSVYYKPRTADSIKENDKIKIGYKRRGSDPDPARYSQILAARGRLGLADTADGMPRENSFGLIEIHYPGERS